MSSDLDSVFYSLVQSLPTYICDSSITLHQFQNFQFAGSSRILFTMDVQSLHVPIPHQEGLRALRFFLEQRPELGQRGGHGYPHVPYAVVDRALNRVEPISCTSALTPSIPSCNSDRAPLILTYRPTSIHIQKISTCHFRHLQQDAITRHIFPSPPLSAFCRDSSLWDTLVHSSFTPNTSPQPHGTCPCNQR
eukprot:g30854.t1